MLRIIIIIIIKYTAGSENEDKNVCVKPDGKGDAQEKERGRG